MECLDVIGDGVCSPVAFDMILRREFRQMMPRQQAQFESDTPVTTVASGADKLHGVAFLSMSLCHGYMYTSLDAAGQALCVAASCLAFVQFDSVKKVTSSVYGASIAIAAWRRYEATVVGDRVVPIGYTQLKSMAFTPVPSADMMRTAQLDFVVTMFDHEATCGVETSSLDIMLQGAVNAVPLVHNASSVDSAFQLLSIIVMHLCTTDTVVVGASIAQFAVWGYAAVELAHTASVTAAAALHEKLKRRGPFDVNMVAIADAVLGNLPPMIVRQKTKEWLEEGVVELWQRIKTNAGVCA